MILDTKFPVTARITPPGLYNVSDLTPVVAYVMWMRGKYSWKTCFILLRRVWLSRSRFTSCSAITSIWYSWSSLHVTWSSANEFLYPIVFRLLLQNLIPVLACVKGCPILLQSGGFIIFGWKENDGSVGRRCCLWAIGLVVLWLNIVAHSVVRFWRRCVGLCIIGGGRISKFLWLLGVVLLSNPSLEEDEEIVGGGVTVIPACRLFPCQ